MNKFELFEGDCLEVMKQFPDNFVNLGIVDPPYNIGKDTWDKFPSHEAYIEWMGRLFLEYQRVLKDNGSFYWFHSEMETIAELMLWIKENTDFVFKQFIVWNKRFDGCRNKGFLDGFIVPDGLRNYQQMAEYCLYYTFQDETGMTQVFSNKDCFQPIKDYMRGERDKVIEREGFTTIQQFNEWVNNITQTASVASRHYFADSQWSFPTEEMYQRLQGSGFWRQEYESLRQEYESLRQEYESLRREYEDLRYTFNNQKTHHSVWNYEIAKANGHATPKPPELIKNIIRHSSNEGDVVLDACAGSGTTGEAAIELGRYPILIELGSDNCESIRQRLGKAQPTLFELTHEPPSVEQDTLL